MGNPDAADGGSWYHGSNTVSADGVRGRGKLAAAVTAAGGLGIIGGGYGDADWLDREFAAAGNSRVGCGFITWSLAKQPELSSRARACARGADALVRRPDAVCASDPGCRQPADMPGADDRAHAGWIGLRCGDIVAQGSEAGGHGATRATLTLVPEVADLLARESPVRCWWPPVGLRTGAVWQPA